MQSKIKLIYEEFQEHNIFLKSEPEMHCMQESVTNNFFKVKDIQGNCYLVRINGKLWPPFTRENEDQNLKKLSLNKIDTSVISNNIAEGFQICFYNNPLQGFAHLLNDKNCYFLLKKLSFLIRKYHGLKVFNNDFSLIDTLVDSFGILREGDKNIFSLYYPIMVGMLHTLNSDIQNKVSSHNDLLPSSIYLKENKLSIVDWEYSGTNHRSYDLAIFSVKSSLTDQQEKIFLNAYDPKNLYDTEYTVALMKPFIILLSLQWHLNSKNPNIKLSTTLQLKLHEACQKALSINCVRTFRSSHVFFFKQKERWQGGNSSEPALLMRAKL